MAHMGRRHRRMGMRHQHKGKIHGSTGKCKEEETAKIAALEAQSTMTDFEHTIVETGPKPPAACFIHKGGNSE